MNSTQEGLCDKERSHWSLCLLLEQGSSQNKCWSTHMKTRSKGDPCAELLQSMVSSGIVIFGLKQSSKLACKPGMLGSWEIILMEAGLKKLQMLSQWPWVHWQSFWPSSKGLLGPEMRFCWAEHSRRLPKTLLWEIRDSSGAAPTEVCSLVLGCGKGKIWVKISVLEDAERAKGRVTKQGVRSDTLLSLCLISILSIWSTKFSFSEMVEVETEFKAISSCLLIGSCPGFVLFLLFPLCSRRGNCCGLGACSKHLVLLDGGLSPDNRGILGECTLLHSQYKKGTRM